MNIRDDIFNIIGFAVIGLGINKSARMEISDLSIKITKIARNQFVYVATDGNETKKTTDFIDFVTALTYAVELAYDNAIVF